MNGDSSLPAHSAVPGLAGFTHRHAAVNGTRIHYAIGGTGPVVVLLHGFPYTWQTWRLLMPRLAAMGHTVIAPDLRGMGGSALEEGGYSKVNVAEDVRQLVHSLGHSRVSLVGTDIGTMVAYAYASRHPDGVGRLVLAESLIPGFGLEDLMNPATGGYWHFGFHAQVDVAAMLIEGREAAYLSPWYAMMSTSAHALADATARFLPHFAAPGAMRAALKHYASMVEDGRENRAHFHEKLAMPVLVLNGERGIPQRQTLHCVEQVARSIEADLVPGAGHAFAADNPAWVAERLARFFQ